ARLAEHAGLGRDAHLGTCAARFQPLSDDCLAFSADMSFDPDGIALGGIDHAPAMLVKPVENGKAGVFVGREAEHIAAQYERNAGDGGVGAHRNFSWIASSAIAASAAPAPLLSRAGSARSMAWASFSTVR